MKTIDLTETRDPLTIHHAIKQMLDSQREAITSGRSRDAYMLELLQRQCLSMQKYIDRLRVILVMGEDSTDGDWAGVERHVQEIDRRKRTVRGGVA